VWEVLVGGLIVIVEAAVTVEGGGEVSSGADFRALELTGTVKGRESALLGTALLHEVGDITQAADLMSSFRLNPLALTTASHCNLVLLGTCLKILPRSTSSFDKRSSCCLCCNDLV